MISRIIKIDEEKFNGCGACASACHEGAIEMIDDKARLTRENYCDGLGDCLPACPVNAISSIISPFSFSSMLISSPQFGVCPISQKSASGSFFLL